MSPHSLLLLQSLTQACQFVFSTCLLAASWQKTPTCWGTSWTSTPPNTRRLSHWQRRCFCRCRRCRFSFWVKSLQRAAPLFHQNPTLPLNLVATFFFIPDTHGCGKADPPAWVETSCSHRLHGNRGWMLRSLWGGQSPCRALKWLPCSRWRSFLQRGLEWPQGLVRAMHAGPG